MSFWKKLFGVRKSPKKSSQSSVASNPQTPSIRPIPATPPESARRASCAACGEENDWPKETPAFGTAISCRKCHASLVPLSEGGYYTPEGAQMFLGYQHCSLESPRCPSCDKTNYSVVFPENGHALPWWANTTPRNPKGFAIDIKCVHCAKNFVVEWDDFPIKDKFCNYCTTLGIGIDFMSIPESRRKDFEWDYGRPPQLRSPIKTGKGEDLWLICPPSLRSAGQGRYRRLVSAAKAFGDGELARGRNLPPSVSLQQLVTGGYVEASRAVRFHGMEVTIPLKDDGTHPLGPCIRVQKPNGKAGALLADGSIRDWSEYSRTVDLLAAAETGPEKATGRSELDSLVVELLQIGRNIEDSKTGKSGFLRKRDSVEDMDHPRAREIGRRLYDMGNQRIELMLKAHKVVEQALGAEAASELECCWHKIGMEDWQSGKGECWMM